VTKLKALILAGGFATRLRPLSCSRPKTLFPVVNKPLLQWIFEKLPESNVHEAILAVNELTEFYIRQHKITKHKLRIKFSIDPPKTPLGTAGPIKNAEKLIGHEEPFLVLNGDIFADLSYKALVDCHRKTGALATIALCKVQDPSRYGVAELEGNGCIKCFIEKPSKEQAPTNLINAGVYVLSPEIFNYIPKGKHVSMERDVFPVLAKEKKLYGHLINGLWIDIGKPDEYLETNKLILDKLGNQRTPKKTDKFEIKAPIALDKGVIIEENTVIGPYAILGENVSVGKNSSISNSVIFPGTKIGDGTTVTGAIIGEGTSIGNNVKIGSGCIIADQAKIKDGVNLNNETSICPAKEVSENIIKRNIIC
jgi:mannose-1-phosphate guanylyltransferase